jgi:hypothetical protein
MAMSDAAKKDSRLREKDASTRFMRVDQLVAARTVAVPAAELFARAGETQRGSSCSDCRPPPSI